MWVQIIIVSVLAVVFLVRLAKQLRHR